MSTTTHTPRPYLTLVGVTLGLVVLLGAVGTISYAMGLTGYAPLVVAFIPLAAVIATVLTARRGWRAVGFRPLNHRRPAITVALVLAATLPLAVVAASTGLSSSALGTLGFAGMALLVGFVEETLFRGILPRRFASPGGVKAMLLTSVAFAVAHSVTALSPEQSRRGRADRRVRVPFRRAHLTPRAHHREHLAGNRRARDLRPRPGSC